VGATSWMRKMRVETYNGGAQWCRTGTTTKNKMGVKELWCTIGCGGVEACSATGKGGQHRAPSDKQDRYEHQMSEGCGRVCEIGREGCGRVCEIGSKESRR
jgi:hypothetical protein